MRQFYFEYVLYLIKIINKREIGTMLRFERDEHGDKEYFGEVANIMANYRNLQKNPECRLKNFLRQQIIGLILIAIFCGILLAVGFLWRFSYLDIVALSLDGLVAFLCFFAIIVYKQRINKMAQSAGKSVFTLDEEGIEDDMNGVQQVRLRWDSIAFVRSFDKCIVFFPKTVESGLIIFTNAENKNSILSFIKENNISVRVI